MSSREWLTLQPVSLLRTVTTPCCSWAGPYRYEPYWLSYPTASFFFTEHFLSLRFNPDAGLLTPERGNVVRVVGHFDDPAAATCTVEIDQEAAGYDENGEPIEVEPPDTEGAPLG